MPPILDTILAYFAAFGLVAFVWLFLGRGQQTRKYTLKRSHTHGRYRYTGRGSNRLGGL